MGFNEDDRIKAKNKVHNDAHKLYMSLSVEGLSNATIASVIRGLLELDPAGPRSKEYQMVLRICGGLHGNNEEVSTGRSNKRDSSDSE